MLEQIEGIVERITFHNSENGWSVIKVSQYNDSNLTTVIVYQAKIFAGAYFKFEGNWITHPKYGKQFKATQAIEKKPSETSALEKYIGSGLIHGIGPAIAKKIVQHFGEETLDVFENRIEELTQISGITEKKLEKIINTWQEHKEIKNVMMFLQNHGVSTLFAVKIFKEYGNKAIEIVKTNPYRLSKDIYGIGFFSADKIALNIGIAKDSKSRIEAAILHILSAGRDKGHCYLTRTQINDSVKILLGADYSAQIETYLQSMINNYDIRYVEKQTQEGVEQCYYNKGLFYEEKTVSNRLKQISEGSIKVDLNKARKTLEEFDSNQEYPLSEEQRESVLKIIESKFSILTGGPGCGKTTTTKALVYLAQSLGKKIILGAPTGRAAQRMSEVIDLQAKTIHRLLVFNPENGGFKKGEEDPLDADLIIIDEASMLDVSITASLLRAIKNNTQVLLIGDTDQLPSVGAGNILKDIIDSNKIPCVRLNKVFRQAGESLIIKYAHQINSGKYPDILSPINVPTAWNDKIDCLFIDAEEATKDQSNFIMRSKKLLKEALNKKMESLLVEKNKKDGTVQYKSIEKLKEHYQIDSVAEEQAEYSIENKEVFVFNIPEKFKHVNLDKLLQSESYTQELAGVLKSIHPWSVVNFGYTNSTMIIKLYNEIIPKYFGKDTEIQILSPMTKGSVGTIQINKNIQETYNPKSIEKNQLTIGDRIFREGDRIIQRKNNYTLEVFNGDIGYIKSIDADNFTLNVEFEKNKLVTFDKSNIIEIDLAYAITIHKSQGSEFDVVIIPITTQHFNMLYRNLIYTGLTRAKKLAIFIGTRNALNMAIRNIDNRQRQTMLKEQLSND